MGGILSQNVPDDGFSISEEVLDRDATTIANEFNDHSTKLSVISLSGPFKHQYHIEKFGKNILDRLHIKEGVCLSDQGFTLFYPFKYIDMYKNSNVICTVDEICSKIFEDFVTSIVPLELNVFINNVSSPNEPLNWSQEDFEKIISTCRNDLLVMVNSIFSSLITDLKISLEPMNISPSLFLSIN